MACWRSCCAQARCGWTASAPRPAIAYAPDRSFACRRKFRQSTTRRTNRSTRFTADAPQRWGQRREDLAEGLVIHKDSSVLVLNKPAGLATQGGSGIKEHVDGMLDHLTFEKKQRPQPGASAGSRHLRRARGRAHRARSGGAQRIAPAARRREDLLGADQGRAEAGARHDQVGAREGSRLRSARTRREDGRGGARRRRRQISPSPTMP